MIKSYQETIFQAAGSCNAQGEMPLPDLIGLLIKIATGHANRGNFGYARLIEQNCSWVLSRAITAIDRLPHINDTFTIKTWVENVGRLMTTRAFEMHHSDGSVMLKAITHWCAINLDTRRPVDLLQSFAEIADVATPGLLEGITEGPKPRPVKEPQGTVDEYRFRFSDIDLNRHVNSCRYIDLIVDHWDVDFFDSRRVSNLDIVFHREAHEKQLARLLVAPKDDNTFAMELAGDGSTLCLCNITFSKR